MNRQAETKQVQVNANKYNFSLGLNVIYVRKKVLNVSYIPLLLSILLQCELKTE